MFKTIHGEGESRWYLPYFIILSITIYFRKNILSYLKIQKKKFLIEKI